MLLSKGVREFHILTMHYFLVNRYTAHRNPIGVSKPQARHRMGSARKEYMWDVNEDILSSQAFEWPGSFE